MQKNMIMHAILIIVFSLSMSSCTDRNIEDSGRIDDWTWDEPGLKACTSPSKQKRARADLKHGQIELKFGEAGEHPVDIIIHHTELIPKPVNGEWEMKWLNEDRFVLDHSDLGVKTWKVEGVIPMSVTVISDWKKHSQK